MLADRSLRLVLAFSVAALLILPAGCARSRQGASTPTAQELQDKRDLNRCRAMIPLLPPAGTIPGLSEPAQVSCYIRSDMPDFLGENAPTYEHLGVVGVLQASFTFGPDSLEIRLYDLQTGPRAQAAFLWFSPGDAQSLALGNEANLDKTTLRCWKGMHYLEVRAALDKEPLAAAKSLAQSIMEKITPAGEPSPSVSALRKVLVNPAPNDIKIVYAEMDLMKASVIIPFYSSTDLLSLEKSGQTYSVEVALAAVPLSDATPGTTIFFIARYPDPASAADALRSYQDKARTDQNPQIREAITLQQDNLLAGVWRPVPGAETLLKQVLENLGKAPQ